MSAYLMKTEAKMDYSNIQLLSSLIQRLEPLA